MKEYYNNNKMNHFDVITFVCSLYGAALQYGLLSKSILKPSS